MTHQLIKRYQMPGRTIEKNIVSSQATLKSALVAKMKDEGFVPLYNIDPVWQWKWVRKDIYDFMLTIQGVYVGKEKAWQIDGILDGKAIPSTPKVK